MRALRGSSKFDTVGINSLRSSNKLDPDSYVVLTLAQPLIGIGNSLCERPEQSFVRQRFKEAPYLQHHSLAGTQFPSEYTDSRAGRLSMRGNRAGHRSFGHTTPVTRV